MIGTIHKFFSCNAFRDGDSSKFTPTNSWSIFAVLVPVVDGIIVTLIVAVSVA